MTTGPHLAVARLASLRRQLAAFMRRGAAVETLACYIDSAEPEGVRVLPRAEFIGWLRSAGFDSYARHLGARRPRSLPVFVVADDDAGLWWLPVERIDARRH
ncbi:MAG: hypothetical protein IPG50_21760 [Myxococcales bacterium]|nr:hypothetical protein [Myxococcales bacterium]